MTGGTSLFAIEQTIFEQFPTYIVGCVVARNIDNKSGASKVQKILAEAEDRVRTIHGADDPKSLPPIAAWREAFSTAGWSASKYPASVEALVKRIARGGEVGSILPAVDLANAAAMTYLTPVGTHDVTSFGDEVLTVRPASTRDALATSTSSEPEQVDEGEIVYAVGVDIRTRRWVWRQSSSAQISPGTTDVFFPIDGFLDKTKSNVEAATAFIALVCRDILHAEVQVDLLHRGNRTFFG